jgi:hypothetical protein
MHQVLYLLRKSPRTSPEAVAKKKESLSLPGIELRS